MKILIIYATNSGSTELVAKQIKETLEHNSNVVDLKHAKEIDSSSLNGYDQILIGTPSWDFDDGNPRPWLKDKNYEGRPHEDIIFMFDRLKEVDFAGRNFFLFGCGDRSYAYFCEGIERVKDFITMHNGKVDHEILKIDGYYFDLDGNKKLVDEWTDGLLKSFH